MGREYTVNSDAIKPVIDRGETQIILERHCNYDREDGNLVDLSIENQKSLARSFVDQLDGESLDDDYFLFIASDTRNSKGTNKRCVDTIKIAMSEVFEFLKAKGIVGERIINFDVSTNYNHEPKESVHLEEPRIFLDGTGYLEFLKDKNGGMGVPFWIDFEEDRYKEERLALGAEGPDEIVLRGCHFIDVLKRYGVYFHEKKPNSRLFIWCCTHYDLISPLAKQTILDYEKEEMVRVNYCGGISFRTDQTGEMVAYINDEVRDFQGKKQPPRHL
ncbi:MAG TPA: hypothetical protein DCY94_03810 [Firmicutes bacterium]|nr:hypothetical protein [Bacillota bacterium]